MQVELKSTTPYNRPARGETVATIVRGIIHPGIFDGWDGVIDNSATAQCVSRRSLIDFRAGGPFYRLGFRGEQNPDIVVQRAEAAIGRRYDFLFFNCKDFVREVEGRTLATLMAKSVAVIAVAGGTALTVRKLRGL